MNSLPNNSLMLVPQKILLIQLRRIGDVLMTTPSVAALRSQFPEAHITFLTERPSDQLFKASAHVNEVLLYKKNSFWSELKFLWSLRQRRFDLVIDFFGNPRSAAMSWITGAFFRIGFNFRGRGLFYTHRVTMSKNGQYAAKHKAQLLEPLGLTLSEFPLFFEVDEQDRHYADQLFEQLGLAENDFVVSLSPVSRQPYKVWPAKNFAEVADWLTETMNAKILFIYGPGEQSFVDDVRQSMKQKALPDYAVPTLSQTRAIFEKVRLHVGNDNGPCHFAIAARTPTVTVFGRPKAVNWTPPDSPQHRAVEFDPGCKQNCVYPACGLECLTGISPQQVIAEIQALRHSLS
ncbi:MAG: glycosyltransferase family 9 protein [SAR324 cluster bacterium]|nr:glycosyltransferase family 9 protein [SAR324 cluster bacterium]